MNIQRGRRLSLLLLGLLLHLLLLLSLLLLLISSRKGVRGGGPIRLCKECASSVDGVRIECIWGWNILLATLRGRSRLGTRLLLLLGMEALLADLWEA